jgi:superfamily II DNA or RNA helicase
MSGHLPNIILQKCINAIKHYIGEGFDDSRLDTLFLAMPISWHGTLQHYVGRLHRLHDGKKIVEVYDYVDSSIPMLARMFEKRLRGYKALGYSIHEQEQRPAIGAWGTSNCDDRL